MKKIIIFGFPHCGTSILKSIIGHIPSVLEIINEAPRILESDIIEAKSKHKEAILIKHPHLINLSKYSDYSKIFVLRNPYFVFTSLNDRFNGDQNMIHSIEQYVKTARCFLDSMKLNIANLYHIKYEDIFDNSFVLIKGVIRELGLHYSDNIFDNNNYNNYAFDFTSELPSLSLEHILHRTEQINRPITNFNEKEKVKLKLRQLYKLFKSKEVKMLGYPMKMKYLIESLWL